MENPITKFESWWKNALVDTPLQQKSAVCVSTIDSDGFPSGRFVDLKGVDERGFTFCTDLDSEKGLHIALNPRVALTIWWDHVGYQVRVRGTADPISEKQAREYWNARTRDAQLTTCCSKQSKVLDSFEVLRAQLAEEKSRYHGLNVPKPDSWGGYRVRPTSIEFLAFSNTRLHKRELFETSEIGVWRMTLLQP